MRKNWCELCLYFEYDKQQSAGSHSKYGDYVMGLCRRFPRKVSKKSYEIRCGEYKKRRWWHREV